MDDETARLAAEQIAEMARRLNRSLNALAASMADGMAKLAKSMPPLISNYLGRRGWTRSDGVSLWWPPADWPDGPGPFTLIEAWESDIRHRPEDWAEQLGIH